MRQSINFASSAGRLSNADAALLSGLDSSGGVLGALDPAQIGGVLPGLRLPTLTNRDPYGHGTHVAAIAAGRGDYQWPDASGVAPGADLYDVRVLDEHGVGNMADVLAGIDWVMQRARWPTSA